MRKITYNHKIFGDEVLGFIGVSEAELEIIDSMPFQRLRRVLQLDVANLVYPNAMHNRFTHSLGAMHLATQMVEEALNWKTKSDKKVDQSERKRIVGELRIASLVHDIGHYALSHCGENALSQTGAPNDAHEKFCVVLAKSDILKGELENAAKECESTYERIMTYINKTQHEEPRYAFQILDSNLDADKLDYLIRDSHHTGVACGMFERDRIIRMLRCIEDTLVVDQRGESAVESYLLARYEMYNQLYLHKTVSSFRGITEKILSYFINFKLLPSFQDLCETPAKICDVDDSRFFALVHQAAKSTLPVSGINQDLIKNVKFLANHLLWRKRFKIAYENSWFKSPQYLKEIAKSSESESNTTLSKYYEKSVIFEKLKEKLEENEFEDAFNKICSENNLPSDSVIIRIEKEVNVAHVTKRYPSNKDEYSKAIILLPKENSKEMETLESLADLITGSSMNVLRVFAHERIYKAIYEIVEKSLYD